MPWESKADSDTAPETAFWDELMRVGRQLGQGGASPSAAASSLGGRASQGGGGDMWLCACGFTNKPSNEVCGGAGPVGCKAPRQDGTPTSGGFGAMRGKSGMVTIARDPYGGGWDCAQCGFHNKPQNTVCGGKGPMGCKAPPDSVPPVGFGISISKPIAQQVGSSARPGKGQAPPQAGSGGKGDVEGGMWVCDCGFSNKSENQVCGGKGPLGCKAVRGAHMQVQPKGSFGHGGGKGGGKGLPQWQCEICGFMNRMSNQVCGGSGPMGCKSTPGGGASIGAAGLIVAQHGGSDWLCHCGFVNKPHNDVCGGKGPMGCKTPRPNEELQEEAF